MIIEALVKIELKSDGTWKIVQFADAICDLKPVSYTLPPVVTPKQPRSMLKHFDRVDDHFKNRDRVRKKRRRDLSREPHHCSDCGKAHTNCRTHPYHNGD